MGGPPKVFGSSKKKHGLSASTKFWAVLGRNPCVKFHLVLSDGTRKWDTEVWTQKATKEQTCNEPSCNQSVESTK